MSGYTKTLFSDTSASLDNTRVSDAVDMKDWSAYSIVASCTGTAATADKTFDSQKQAVKAIADLTYTAVAAGVAGNSITIDYNDSVKASKIIQDLTFTADAKGTGGNSITVTYAGTGFGGQEAATAVGNDISVAMQGSNSYAVKTGNGGSVASGTIQGIVWTGKIRGSFVNMVYASGGSGGAETSARTGTGTVGDPYIVTATVQASSSYAVKTSLGGVVGSLVIQDLTLAGDTDERGTYFSVVLTDDGDGGSEAVTRSGAGTVGDPYIFDVAMQSGAAYSAKTFGAGAVDEADNTITISSNGFRDHLRVQFSTTAADLPDPLVAATDYWIFEVDNDTFKVAASQVDAAAGTAINLTDGGTGTHTITPMGSLATELETAFNAEADFTDVANVTVSGTGTNVQNAQVVTAFTGTVASSVDVTANSIAITAHGYINGTRLTFTSSGAAPTGLTSGHAYRVVNRTDDSFKLELIAGGGAIDITDQGASGSTLTFTPAPTTITELVAAVAADGDSNTVVGSASSGATAMDVQTSTALTGAVASAVDVSNNTFTSVSHSYLDGTRLRVASTGTLPASNPPGTLAINTDYWVVNKTADTFKLSASYGGGAIDLTDQGTAAATITFTPRATIATEIETAINAGGAGVTGLVDVAVTGTGTNAQATATSTALEGGLGGAAGSEQVLVTGTDIVIYIEDGVSTATQVKAKYDAKAEAIALATVAITGVGGNAQSVIVQTALAGGAAAEVDTGTGVLSIPTHGLTLGAAGQLTTTGTLPAPLAISTTYYVIPVTAGTIKLASSYDNAIAGTGITLTDTGSDNAVHTFDTTALAGTLQVQVTVDDPSLSSANWVSFGSPTVISGSSSAILYSTGTNVPTVFPFRAVRLQANVTGGAVAVSAKMHVKR